MANVLQSIDGFACGPSGTKNEDKATNEINPTRNNFHLFTTIPPNAK